jgi:hypothetical protein
LKFLFRKLKTSVYFTEKFIFLTKKLPWEKLNLKISWFLKIIRFLLQKVLKHFGVIIDVLERTIKWDITEVGQNKRTYATCCVLPVDLTCYHCLIELVCGGNDHTYMLLLSTMIEKLGLGEPPPSAIPW